MYLPEDTTSETIVVPLFETVVYPGVRTKLPVEAAVGEALLTALKSEGSASAEIGRAHV